MVIVSDSAVDRHYTLEDTYTIHKLKLIFTIRKRIELLCLNGNKIY